MHPTTIQEFSKLKLLMDENFNKKSKSDIPKYESEVKQNNNEYKYKLEIVWLNVIIFSILHVWALYGIYLIVFHVSWRHALYAYLMASITGLGITAGAHRLYAHKAYKAKFPLRLLLVLLQTAAGQNSMYIWARDHRVHHKFSETDADPHNSNRGFFFAHMGWLFCKKHKDVIEKGKTVDMSDLEKDPLIRFQYKYYWYLFFVCSFVVPIFTPWYFWGEPFWSCVAVSGIFRYIFSLHVTWCINSVAHLYGIKPYDKNIGPVESYFNLSLISNGEGWHNYHHVYPWDYKAAEFGYKENMTTAFIDFWALFGLAYDRKTVSNEVIEQRVQRTGDGSRPQYVPTDSIVNKIHDGNVFTDRAVFYWIFLLVAIMLTFIR